MKLTWITCALTLAAAACSDDDPGTFDAPVTYGVVVPPYETVEACRAANPDSLYNCQPTVAFCPNGTYHLLVTDIINGGTYELDGDTVRVTSVGPGDGPETFVATLDGDTLRSPDLPFGGVWTKLPGVPAPFCEF